MPNLLDRLKTALSDRYAIEDELGAGGMATVYLAEDIKHPLTSWFPWALHGLRHHVGGRFPPVLISSQWCRTADTLAEPRTMTIMG